jgi:AI-2 transport protein TqsA
VDVTSKAANTSVTVLAVLGVMAALYLLKPILVPVALAFLLACLLGPAIQGLRRLLPLGPTGAAVALFLLLAVLGLYLASLTAESLVRAANTLPSDVERLAQRLSHRLTDTIRDQPHLAALLPEPGTINSLGNTNRRLLLAMLTRRLVDLPGWVAQGLIVLILVVFLLAESEMLTPKLVRFFAPAPGDARAAERTLQVMTRQIRAYLLARTLINLGLGVVVAAALWLLGVNFPVALGAFAALTNFIPYVGQVIGGALPVLVVLGQSESIGDAMIVAAVFLAVVTVEGYIVTPLVLGRSLDLNGTTVLLACLLWGFLWGLVGLILAMPITVTMKLIFQHVPSLHRWAELMSRDWQTPLPAVAGGQWPVAREDKDKGSPRWPVPGEGKESCAPVADPSTV